MSILMFFVGLISGACLGVLMAGMTEDESDAMDVEAWADLDAYGMM